MGNPDYAETETRFQRETAGHKMTILQDSGLHRHIRFHDPKYGFYWFELITTPGALIFRGDGETFAFSCGKDTLDLFRRGIHRDGSIHINPGYWDTKLSSERDAAQRYSQEKFNALVAEQLADAEAQFPGVAAAWAEHVGEMGEYNTEYEPEAQRAMFEFDFGERYKGVCGCGESETRATSLEARDWAIQHQRQEGKHKAYLDTVPGFSFEDIEARDMQDHYWWFLWALYAICWGIKQYDAQRRREAELLLAALPAGRKATARRRKAARRHAAAANRRTVDRELMALIRRETAGALR